MEPPGMGMQTLIRTSKPPPAKGNRVLLIILGVALLLITLIVTGAVVAFRAAMGSSTQATAVGDQFLAALGAHHYQAAYALYTPQMQTVRSVAFLQVTEASVEQHLGPYVGHGPPAWNVQTWNGQTSVSLSYPVQFARGGATASLVMVKSGSSYRVSWGNYYAR